MTRGLFLFLALALSASTASAQTLTLSGFVDDGSAPANGVFAFTFALEDAAGAALWQEEQPATLIVDGVFAADLGSVVPLPPSVPVDARLRVTIEGDELPAFPLARLAQARRAGRVETADVADVTAAVAGAAAAQLATVAALASVPGAPVAFAHVTGVPAEIADGDSGAVVVATAGGVGLASGSLFLTAVPGDRLADGSVTDAKLPAGAVQARHVVDGSIDSTHVADGALGRAQLSADVTDREVRTASVFRVDNPVCGAARGTLTTRSTCDADACVRTVTISGNDVLVPGGLDCSGNGFCQPVLTCANTLVGRRVLP